MKFSLHIWMNLTRGEKETSRHSSASSYFDVNCTRFLDFLYWLILHYLISDRCDELKHFSRAQNFNLKSIILNWMKVKSSTYIFVSCKIGWWKVKLIDDWFCNLNKLGTILKPIWTLDLTFWINLVFVGWMYATYDICGSLLRERSLKTSC